MITRLSHTENEFARAIHTVFQRAYRVEAELIGLTHFAPLDRNIENIHGSNTQFFGTFQSTQLIAVVKISRQGLQLDIDSLVVDPDHFRQVLLCK